MGAEQRHDLHPGPEGVGWYVMSSGYSEWPAI